VAGAYQLLRLCRTKVSERTPEIGLAVNKLKWLAILEIQTGGML
jgi:hypothetical protein